MTNTDEISQIIKLPPAKPEAFKEFLTPALHETNQQKST